MIVRLYIEPTIGREKLSKVGPPLVDQLYQYLAKEQGLSDSTVRKVHAVLRGAFGRAVKWGWLDRNPAASVSPPMPELAETVMPMPDQVAMAISAAEADNVDFGMFVRMAAATGARRGELCALRWSSINLATGVLRIDSSVYAVKGGGSRVKDTKNHSKRDVALDAITAGELRAHRRRLDGRASSCGVELVADAFVFTDEADGSAPWLPDRTSHAWERLRGRIGGSGWMGFGCMICGISGDDAVEGRGAGGQREQAHRSSGRRHNVECLRPLSGGHRPTSGRHHR